MRTPLSFVALLVFSLSSITFALTLAQDGQPRAAIVLPDQPTALDNTAASELQLHLKKISGAEIAILPRSVELKPGTAPIYIGGSPDAKENLEIDNAVAQKQGGEFSGAFGLFVTNNHATLRGLRGAPEGTRIAAAELLEQLGVRWFFPGELGTVIPSLKTIELKEQKTIQAPSFTGRWHQGGATEWYGRMRMGGPFFPGAHGLPLGPDSEFEKHPEFYSLIKGERKPYQHCVSNPEVIRRVVEQTKAYFKQNPTAEWIGMGPNDGSGFCECDKCMALDSGEWDAFASEPSNTDRYIWFFNQVLAGIRDEYPNKRLGFYAYHTYMMPPTKVKPDPRIVPALAPINTCRVHSPLSPICAEMRYINDVTAAWGKVVPEVYFRGYWFNLADPGTPFSMVHRMREQIPLGKKQGIAGWRVETMMHWASESPSLYLSARLLWNCDANADAILDDFYEKFFPSAAKPMKEYFELMDAALRDSDHHTGCSFDLPYFYPKATRDKARKLLDTAADRAKEKHSDTEARRVAIFRDSFDYGEALIAMLEKRAELDLIGSKDALDRMLEIRKRLIAYDPPMIAPHPSEVYIDRFFGASVMQGAKRITGGNELVAALRDEWSFQIDPTRVGFSLGWQQADLAGGNWQKIKTSSSSWSNQGLRYYKGEAWYRQTVEVPKKFEGRRVFLWFGGVDEKAQVFVNGQEIGISHAAAMLPFEMDATSAIRPGRTNVVAVRVRNVTLDELGTGGILAPVIFYAPAAGKEATLENSPALSKEF